MLEFQGHLIAAHFSLIYHGRCYSPVVAYDENFKRYAPGHLIVAELLKDCAGRGIHTYDITGKADEWKMKWTNNRISVRHHLVFKGPVGCLAHAMGVRIKPAVSPLVAWLGKKRTNCPQLASLLSGECKRHWEQVVQLQNSKVTNRFARRYE